MPLQSSSSCGQVSRFFVWERRMLYFRAALLKGMNYRIPEISISRKIWVHILQSEQHMKLFCGKNNRENTNLYRTPAYQNYISQNRSKYSFFLRQLLHAAILNAFRLTDFIWIICSKRVHSFPQFFFPAQRFKRQMKPLRLLAGHICWVQ